MIRINLLPVKKEKKREAGQRQLVLMALGIVGMLGFVTYMYIDDSSTLDDLRRENRRLAADIERLKQEMGDYDKVKAQREKLLKQRSSIQALQAGRTGPVFLLRELSELLTPSKGPTFDRVAYEEALRRDPNTGFNPSWETKRVWLESYDEQAKKAKIRAAAKSTDDVAEFMKRLQLSVFFSEVQLEGQQEAAAGGQGGVRHYTFNLAAGVMY
jgi:type IV pilus assembly protein PilN